MKVFSTAPFDLGSPMGGTWLLNREGGQFLHFGSIGSTVEVVYEPEELPQAPLSGSRLVIVSGSAQPGGLGCAREVRRIMGLFHSWLAHPQVEAMWLLPLRAPATADFLGCAFDHSDALVVKNAAKIGDYLALRICCADDLVAPNTQGEQTCATTEQILLDALVLLGCDNVSAHPGGVRGVQSHTLPSLRRQLILKIAPSLKPVKQKLPKRLVAFLYKFLEKIQ